MSKGGGAKRVEVVVVVAILRKGVTCNDDAGEAGSGGAVGSNSCRLRQ